MVTHLYAMNADGIPEDTFFWNLWFLQGQTDARSFMENPPGIFHSKDIGTLVLDLIEPVIYMRNAVEVMVQPLSSNNGLLIIVDRNPPLMVEFTGPYTLKDESCLLGVAKVEDFGSTVRHPLVENQTQIIWPGQWTSLRRPNTFYEWEFRIRMRSTGVQLMHPKNLTFRREDSAPF